MSEKDTGLASSRLIRRHLLFGWWALLVFLTLGLVLEGLHGFKVGWYLDVSNASRRLMWSLAHAHGTLLALVNCAFAYTVERLRGPRALAGYRLASVALLAASVLMPAGFLLGGWVIYGGDPGPGVLLVVVGGLLLLAAVLLTAWNAGRQEGALLESPAESTVDAEGESKVGGRPAAGKKGRRRS